MDRCHRIGQTKPVHVYRLATAQSVEVTHLYFLTLFVFYPVALNDVLRVFNVLTGSHFEKSF